MGVRSDGRKLSFDILSNDTSFLDDETSFYGSNSDPPARDDAEIGKVSPESKPKRRRKSKGAKRKKTIENSILEDSVVHDGIDSGIYDSNGLGLDLKSYSVQSVVCEELTVPEESLGSVRELRPAMEAEFQNSHAGDGYFVGELRQRTVNGSSAGDGEEAVPRINGNVKEDTARVRLDFSAEKQREELNVNAVRKLETEKSLDWKQLMAEDPNFCY